MTVRNQSIDMDSMGDLMSVDTGLTSLHALHAELRFHLFPLSRFA